MDALEHVSEIWLVAKAVQDLFETVLSSAGYEKSLDAPAGSTYRKRLGATTSGFKSSTNASHDMDGSTPSSRKMALTPALRIWREAALSSAVTPKASRKSPDLPDTSSNVNSNSKPVEQGVFSDDWRDTAEAPAAQVVQNIPNVHNNLEVHSNPNVHNIPNIHNNVEVHNQPIVPSQGPYDAFDPTFNYSLGYFPDDQTVLWSPEWVEGGVIPAPTGFNPSEW